MLNELLELLNDMPEDEQAEVVALALDDTKNMKWVPNSGVQTEAYFSMADIIYYGGAGGGGKTDFGIGLAFNEHKRTLIVRRQFADLSGIIDRVIEVNGSNKGFRGSPRPRLVTDDGRIIDFGAAKNVGDEQSRQGVAIDLLYVDEAAQFAESQVRFWMGWVRTTIPGQRCQIVFGSNPPLSEEGLWLLKMFAAWLDPAHPNPAKPGELRWYIKDDDDNDVEVDGPGPHQLGDELLTAMSRTFIPAKRDDNPHLDASYKAKQDNLPPHLRAAIRDGNFAAARRDHQLQLIPSEWISLSQGRWKSHPPEGIPQCAIGVDIAQGGTDKTVLARRHDGWFAEFIVKSGAETPDGLSVAGLVMSHRRDESSVIIDMGGGYGGSAYEQLRRNIDNVVGYKGSESTTKRTANGKLPFFNTRAACYYALYEALDPSQPGGQRITLPPDPELFADLCSIRLAEDSDNIIKLEPKKDLVARIGRSTNKSDAVGMGWFAGNKIENSYHMWQNNKTNRKLGRRPAVLMGNRQNKR